MIRIPSTSLNLLTELSSRGFPRDENDAVNAEPGVKRNLYWDVADKMSNSDSPWHLLTDSVHEPGFSISQGPAFLWKYYRLTQD